MEQKPASAKTILFIEDDPFIVDMYSHVLTKAGYRVETAGDGNNGYKLATATEHNLILLDIMIPGINGIDLLEKLRGADGKGLPNTKIVVLTNLAQDDESRRALEAQADGYLIKADVTPKKLVELVSQIIGN